MPLNWHPNYLNYRFRTKFNANFVYKKKKVFEIDSWKTGNSITPIDPG